MFDGLRTSDSSDVRTPTDVRYLLHFLLAGLCIWLPVHYWPGRPMETGRPMSRYRMSGFHRMSDTYAVRQTQWPFGRWAIYTPPPLRVRVEHFTQIKHKNTSAPSHSLLHQILDPGEILESSWWIFHPVIDLSLPHLPTKANHVLSKS